MDMKGPPVNRTRNFWNDFKAFAFSDSLLKVAVAFVLATAFTVLIKAFVDSFIMPLIAAIVGDTSFEDLVFTVNGSTFTYGSFLSALITFILMMVVPLPPLVLDIFFTLNILLSLSVLMVSITPASRACLASSSFKSILSGCALISIAVPVSAAA